MTVLTGLITFLHRQLNVADTLARDRRSGVPGHGDGCKLGRYAEMPCDCGATGRALADIAARRVILDLATAAIRDIPYGHRYEFIEAMAREWGTAYSGHPGYRPEWAPVSGRL